MHHYSTVIDILYNPVRYCDKSWVTKSIGPVKNCSLLPAYLKNHFILAHTAPLPVPEKDTLESEPVMLFIRNWHKMQRAAFLIGLKLFSAQIVNSPFFMKSLSNQQRAFLCLPIPFTSSKVITNVSDLNHDALFRAGASFIDSLATEMLPKILLVRLRLIFPSSYSYGKDFCESVDKSLSVLKWAFDYA